MKAYIFDQNGFYLASVDSQKDPLESRAQKKDVFLRPANSTGQPPPQNVAPDEVATWNGKAWSVIKRPVEKVIDDGAPVVAPDETNELTPEEIETAKASIERLELVRNRLIANRKAGLSKTPTIEILEDIIEILVGV